MAVINALGIPTSSTITSVIVSAYYNVKLNDQLYHNLFCFLSKI